MMIESEARQGVTNRSDASDSQAPGPGKERTTGKANGAFRSAFFLTLK